MNELLQWALNNPAFTLIGAFTVVQVVPIKINPWSWLIRMISNVFNQPVIDRINESEATSSRYRIMRFDDEIRHEVRHTKEHFDQLMGDIDDYEQYCADHPQYKNSKAVFAIANIKRVYEKCSREGTFLE